MKKKTKNKKIIIEIVIAFVICILTTYILSNADNFYATSEETEYDNTNSRMKATNVKGALDELYKCMENVNAVGINLQVGDYIKMEPIEEEYTVKTEYTNYREQTEKIYPKELSLWRIIKINEDGTYDAISDKVSSTNITFNGKMGYQNYIGYLNMISKLYENPEFTVSSRYFGYNSQTEFITNTEKFKESVTSAPWQENTNEQEEHLGKGDTSYNTDYNLVNTVYGNSIAKKVNTDENTSYWLASRYYNYSNENEFYFKLRVISSQGEVSNNSIYYYENEWKNTNNSHAIRPIIVLKSNLKAIGTGTKEDPYILK